MSCTLTFADGSVGDLCNVLFGDGFSTGEALTEHADCWLSSTIDDGRREGCGVGFATCGDFPDDVMNGMTIDNGDRWLAYDPRAGTVDAYGRQADLHSNSMNLLPDAGGMFRIGSCFRNGGVECYGVHSCQCFPWNLNEIGLPANMTVGEYCEGKPNGTVIPGHFPTRDFYRGFGFGNSFDTDMVCKNFKLTPKDVEVFVRTDQFLSPDIVRFSNVIEGDCNANPLISCTGRVQPSQSEDGFTNTVPDPPEFYNSNVADRQRFDEVFLVNPSMFWKLPGGLDSEGGNHPAPIGEPINTVATIETPFLSPSSLFEWDTTRFKNRVMTKILAWTGNPGGGNPWDVVLDRLDHVHTQSTGNTEIGEYARVFDATGAPDPFAVMIPVETVRGRVRGFDCWGNVDVFVRRVSMTMSIKPTTIDRLEGVTRYVRTHVRFFMDIDLAARAQFDGILFNTRTECQAIGPLINDASGINFPIDQNSKQLVYELGPQHGGRPFRLERRLSWAGYHGRAGDGWNGDVKIKEGFDSLCKRKADAMSVRVFGWPTDLDQPDGKRATAYGGGFTIGFRNQ